MAGGDVILLEGDDYTGRAVNLASRLAGAAGPNEVLTTPELAELAAGGAEPAGPFEVKGLADPVDAWLLHVPLPASSA
jgi:class 3 adenylate cyclase